MARLLVISAAPVQVVGDRLRLDIKFVEGMRFTAAHWSGSVDYFLRECDEGLTFSATYSPEELPFGIKPLSASKQPSTEDLAMYDIILCSGDDAEYLSVIDLCATLPTRIYYIIEYTIETRLQIIFLDRDTSFYKKAWRVLWALRKEMRRRRAFRKAAGILANGYPAYIAYARINSNTILYLDNRITKELLINEGEMLEKREWLLTGGRLRLIHSGRLEYMKGAQDLVPVAVILKKAGIDFELNIFGSGSLEGSIREEIKHKGLEDRVFLRGTVDFKTELVPFARTQADIFLSCHRQSDPSCTYMESMGCGLAIVGYQNRMWEALCTESSAGWHVPLGDYRALAQKLVDIARRPSEALQRCEAARSFAAAHLFETEFHKRITHIEERPSC